MILGFTPERERLPEGIVLTIVYLGIAMLVAMAVSGGAAVGLERRLPAAAKTQRAVAGLPDHRDRQSFVIQEFVHFVLPQASTKGSAAATRSSRSGWCSRKSSSPSSARRSPTSAGDHRRRPWSSRCCTDVSINRTKFGRGIRAVAQDPTTATLMGVSRERIIMTDVPHRRHAGRRRRAALHAEGAEGDHLLRRIHPRHQGLLRGRARRHRQPARRPARRPASSASWRTTARCCSAPGGATSSPSSCSS